ncbi:hypothetical protein CTI12_AA295120 [Artemisia annua]|uniref:Uncharacterized protein n=1 Tax=Artemisia annua TaxID=35608 RepID=A0A2U1M1H3_ARTAN|nr:hypothetical protein CTI12_AA295120 [Artemisia annua]
MNLWVRMKHVLNDPKYGKKTPKLEKSRRGEHIALRGARVDVGDISTKTRLHHHTTTPTVISTESFLCESLAAKLPTINHHDDVIRNLKSSHPQDGYGVQSAERKKIEEAFVAFGLCNEYGVCL